MKRVITFSKALWHETVKRLPYVGLILIVVILFQVFKTGAQVVENIEISKRNSESNMVVLARIAEISENNKSLSEDNKRLSEQSKALSEQSNRYQQCIAQLFAQYTRDYRPVVIEDLDTCSAYTMPVAQSNSTAPSTSQSTPQATPQSTSQPTPQPSSPSGNPNAAVPKACRLKVLGICFRN